MGFLIGWLALCAFGVGYAVVEFTGDDDDDDDDGEDDAVMAPETEGNIPEGGTPEGPVERTIAEGTEGDDTFVGTDEDEGYLALNGDDIAHGNGGSDLLNGGFADDFLTGGDGDDILQGGAGDDSLHGGTGDDSLTGGTGDDLLKGREDDDFLAGNEGDDGLYGREGDDFLYGGEGDDTLSGGTGSDRMEGGTGADILDGAGNHDGSVDVAGLVGAASDQADTDADFLDGGAGDDLLILGENDAARGGLGSDTFVVGDWISDGAEATVRDFDPDRDTIAVGVSGGASQAGLKLTDFDDGSGTSIVLDGVEIARVNGGQDLTRGDLEFFDTDAGPVLSEEDAPAEAAAPVTGAVSGGTVADGEVDLPGVETTIASVPVAATTA